MSEGKEIVKEGVKLAKMIGVAAVTTVVTLPIAQTLQRKVGFGHVMRFIGRVADGVFWIVPDKS